MLETLPKDPQRDALVAAEPRVAASSLRIGYLVQQFPPEVGAGPARVLEMATRWRQHGAHVTAITAMPNRPEGRIHAGYRGRFAVEEDWEGIRTLRAWLFASPKRGFARTIANNVTFMMTSAAIGTLRASRLDILIASSPPFFPHLSGRAVSALKGVPLVLEIRDLWPDYLVDMGLLTRGGLAARALFAVERRLLHRADAVTVVTESFRERIVAKGVPRERIVVLPNGADTAFYHASDEPPCLPALERRPGDFLVGYLGNFGAGQALTTVLDAAEIVHRLAPEVRFVLVGDGPEREHLLRQTFERGLSNLSLHPPILKGSTRAFYANCDICLVPLAPVPVFQDTIPSKIFEIMASERPVLASVDGEARRIMEVSGGGLVVAPGNASAMADGILALRALPASARCLMGQRGRAYVHAHYERSVIADRYLELLERVAARVRRS